jgi:hypothetical protein
LYKPDDQGAGGTNFFRRQEPLSQVSFSQELWPACALILNGDKVSFNYVKLITRALQEMELCQAPTANDLPTANDRYGKEKIKHLDCNCEL